MTDTCCIENLFKRKYSYTISAKFPFVDLKESYVKIELEPSKDNHSGTIVCDTFSKDKETEKSFTEICKEYMKYKIDDDIQHLLGTVTLTRYDGCGTNLEKWELHSVKPINVSFGDYNDSQGTVDYIIKWEYESCSHTLGKIET